MLTPTWILGLLRPMTVLRDTEDEIQEPGVR